MSETLEERMSRPERFRKRGPCMSIENECILPGKHKQTWGEALKWINGFKPEKVHSFKLQVNFVREPRKQGAPK